MSADHDDIVAVGGDLEPETLIHAYRRGIFPWPSEGLPLLWYCPRARAILDFADLHIPRRLERERRKSELRFTIDRWFEGVIQACADSPRPEQDGTWITPEMIRVYVQLHELGVAHSIEAWRGAQLVGGIYGVDAGGAFSAESMFYIEPNASKLALLHLIEHLQSGGLDWIDIQVLTPHLENLGARNISRRSFLRKLERALETGLELFDPTPDEG